PTLFPYTTLFRSFLAERLLQPGERFRWGVWLALLVAEIALLYSHNLSVPVVRCLNLVVTGVWLVSRRWRHLAIWIGGQALALALYLPWVLSQSPSCT